VNTIDGPTKLVRQDAILGGLSIGQFNPSSAQHGHRACIQVHVIVDHANSAECMTLTNEKKTKIVIDYHTHTLTFIKHIQSRSGE